MRKFIVIIVMLISSQILTQDYNTPYQQNRAALRSITIINEILSVIDTTSDAQFEKKQPGLVDSICGRYKTVRDYEEEKVSKRFSGNIEDLGNELRYYSHFLEDLKVSYATFKIFLFKVSFKFRFRYATLNGKTFEYIPSDEFLDSLIQQARFPININYTKYDKKPFGFSYSVYLNSVKNQLLKYKKDLALDIIINKSEDVLKGEIESTNDPTNNLEYGFGCGIGGDTPEGLGVFAKLVHYKKIDIIEQLLYSPNPVTRLMAVDATEYYANNNFYTPSNKTVNKMEEIKNEETIINTCWGCFFEDLKMKDAYIKATENKKHLYDNIIFIK